MRTTIDLPEDLLQTAKGLAENRHQTLSRVITDLARKGLEPEPVKYTWRNGFPVLTSSPGAGIVTPEHIKELEAQGDLEMARKYFP